MNAIEQLDGVDVDDQGASVLRTVVELHNRTNMPVVYDKMAQRERQTVDSLSLVGLLEVRKLAKDGERMVIPTALGRRHVADAAAS